MSDIGFLFVPKHIMARKDLSLQEKVVFGRIVGLTNEYGYCFATNNWLGEQIGLSGERVKKIIGKLKKLKVISVEIERKTKDTHPPSTQWYTRRKIFVWNQGLTPMGVENDPGVGVENDPYSKEIKKRENNPPVIREANASPNLLVPLKEKTGVNPDLLKHLERKKERKANKGAWRNGVAKKGVENTYNNTKLTKEEGLAISLTDNVDNEVILKLSISYDISMEDVRKCKQDYINWVLGSSFEPKVWGKNMRIYVEKFCSQKASKGKKKPKKETKHKSMFDEINEQTGAFPEYLGDKDE